MKKTATFTNKDVELVKRIQQYQKEQGFSNFIDAIRKLCDDALQLKSITK